MFRMIKLHEKVIVSDASVIKFAVRMGSNIRLLLNLGGTCFTEDIQFTSEGVAKNVMKRILDIKQDDGDVPAGFRK